VAVTVNTVKGQKGTGAHPGHSIAHANVSLDDSEEFQEISFLATSTAAAATAQVGVVNFQLYYLMGFDPFGNPMYANVTFQMSLLDFFLLLGI
jgi:hypothetical protein